MSIKIDLSSLSHKDALDLAIIIEEEAKERYREFVDQMEQHHTLEAAQFFHDMMEIEAREEAKLTVRRRSMYRDAPRNVKHSVIWNIEAPEYDEVRAFMSARQAMEAALQSETKAYDFFQSALPQIQDPEARKVFEGLCDDALQHQELVRRKMAGLSPDPLIDPEAFIDEPTAQ